MSMLAGCAGSAVGGDPNSYLWLDHGRHIDIPNRGAFQVMWTKQLNPLQGGKYIPVEYASAGLDAKRNRIYIGTTLGILYAFDVRGAEHFIYRTDSSFESRPAVDPKTGEVFVATNDGVVHALSPKGELLWKRRIGGPMSEVPVLTDDAVYIVNGNDLVNALSRKDGEILWGYQGEQIEEFTIAGHAGLKLIDGKLLTGLTNGTVIALNPSDGRLLWDTDTSVDAEVIYGDSPQFFDVDTEPVVIGDTIYVASYTTGLYALDLLNGTVRWREPTLRTVVGMAQAGSSLVLSSSRQGVILFDLLSRKVTWEHPPMRGAPSQPVVTSKGTVLVGETLGSLLALTLNDGREVCRVESGYGFAAPPNVAGDVGVALTNSGRLMALRLR